MSEIILKIEGVDPLELYGEKNKRINLVKKAYPDVTITSRGNNIKIVGNQVDAQKAKQKIELMVKHLKLHDDLSDQTVKELINGDGPKDNLIPKNDKNISFF